MALAVGVTLVAVAFAGCGGGGEGSPVAAGSTVSGSTNTTTDSGEGGGARPGPGELERQLNAPPTPEQRVRRVTTAVLTLGKPVTCSPLLVTARYVEAAYGGHRGCVEAQSRASAADRVVFKRVTVNGDEAMSVVVPSGGPYDGERIAVSLVHSSHWAVDTLRSNVPVGP